MGKPIEHAENSVKKYGGKISDYLYIHEFLDSSQSAVPDLRHRMLTHNAWFITTIMPKLFGSYITNSDGKNVAIQSICEDHVFEDLERYPSAQDWANEIQWKDWMKNHKIIKKEVTKDPTNPPYRPKFDKEKWWKELEVIKNTKTPETLKPWYYDPNKSLRSEDLFKTDTECTITS